MINCILTINVGSATLKFSICKANSDVTKICYGDLDSKRQSLSVYEGDNTLHKCEVTKDTTDLMRPKFLLQWIKANYPDVHIIAIGHRIVHGGKYFTKPTTITPDVLKQLKLLISLAPLHMPYEIDFISKILEEYPDIPQVACFDTSFHCTQPRLATMFGLPRKYTEEGVVRYGFHGLSYENATFHLKKLVSPEECHRVVVAHLGNGDSACAILDGQSIATTMGYTALDGLMMGTRCGNIDPGVMLFLMKDKGMSPAEIEKLIYKDSGLLGVSEISSDVRTLIESKDPRAKEAIELFCYRATREIGSLVAALQGLDTLVFTGGIGENAVIVRELICKQLSWLGIKLSVNKNKQGASLISEDDSTVKVCIIKADEERVIAHHTLLQIEDRRAA